MRRGSRRAGLALVILGLPTVLLAWAALAPSPTGAEDLDAYAPAQLRILRSLWIGSLGPPPPDPSNAHHADPAAARLGQAVFLDSRFSANGQVACVSCHVPALSFQDGRPTAQGIGPVRRRSMPLLGAAYGTWFFWDGRKDSLWAQALGPLESPAEHGISRTRVAELVATHYRDRYEAVFGPLPSLPSPLPPGARPAADDAAARRAWESLEPADRDRITRVFVDVGKAVAAFVRTIRPGPARFDRYVEPLLAGRPDLAASVLSPAEKRGLRLFIGRAKCTNCHAGPLLTNGEFHATLVPPAAGEPPDQGRAEGLAEVRGDEFNCLGRWSDARPEACTALRFAPRDPHALARAFKTPTLRNVAVRPPYMHAGQFGTLGEVLAFYRTTSSRVKDLEHGHLSDADLADLEAFLGTLTGAVESM